MSSLISSLFLDEVRSEPSAPNCGVAAVGDGTYRHNTGQSMSAVKRSPSRFHPASIPRTQTFVASAAVLMGR